MPERITPTPPILFYVQTVARYYSSRKIDNDGCSRYHIVTMSMQRYSSPHTWLIKATPEQEHESVSTLRMDHEGKRAFGLYRNEGTLRGLSEHERVQKLV